MPTKSSKTTKYNWNPKTDLMQIHPVKVIGDYAIVDVLARYGSEYILPWRYFLHRNKVILVFDGLKFKKLYLTSTDSRGNRKIKSSATGKYTLTSLLDKEAKGLIYMENIPDIEVLKYIPPYVMEGFGYSIPSVTKGMPFIIRRLWG